MAIQYQYRIRTYTTGSREVADVARAWTYADMLDVLPTLVRTIGAADRPIRRVEIDLVDTLADPTEPVVPADTNTYPRPEEGGDQ